MKVWTSRSAGTGRRTGTGARSTARRSSVPKTCRRSRMTPSRPSHHHSPRRRFYAAGFMYSSGLSGPLRQERQKPPRRSQSTQPPHPAWIQMRRTPGCTSACSAFPALGRSQRAVQLSDADREHATGSVALTVGGHVQPHVGVPGRGGSRSARPRPRGHRHTPWLSHPVRGSRRWRSGTVSLARSPQPRGGGCAAPWPAIRSLSRVLVSLAAAKWCWRWFMVSNWVPGGSSIVHVREVWGPASSPRWRARDEAGVPGTVTVTGATAGPGCAGCPGEAPAPILG